MKKEAKTEENEIKFRCRNCNRPLKNIMGAYNCECKNNEEKRPFWPPSIRARRKPRAKNYKNYYNILPS